MRNYFKGMYFKCQSEDKTLAVIPAVHQVGRKRICSIQVITEEGSYVVAYPGKAYRRKKGKVYIGRSCFDESGMYLAVNTKGLHLKGRIAFGKLTPLKYHIMGPFHYLPFMECRHDVRSMCHSVDGTVFLNGEKYSFHVGKGYWEGDKGKVFPSAYLWTQSFLPQGSVMLAVADIPMGALTFTGIIAVVLWKGKEYRLATYLGAEIIEKEDGMVRIRQGKLELEAQLLKASEQPLRAPSKNGMGRIIHESVACKVFYRFRRDGHTLFALESSKASFEQGK